MLWPACGPLERASLVKMADPHPTWETPIEACILIAKGATFSTAFRIALVVGTLLTLVNQGSTLLDGHIAAATWLRTGANYVIPYVVASVGYLMPLRHQ